MGMREAAHSPVWANGGPPLFSVVVPREDHHFTAAIPFCSASIAALMAWYIWVYPVQRHRLLLRASRISSSLGSGFVANRCFTVIMKPGVQNPHCAPPQSP